MLNLIVLIIEKFTLRQQYMLTIDLETRNYKIFFTHNMNVVTYNILRVP